MDFVKLILIKTIEFKIIFVQICIEPSRVL